VAVEVGERGLQGQRCLRADEAVFEKSRRFLKTRYGKQKLQGVGLRTGLQMNLYQKCLRRDDSGKIKAPAGADAAGRGLEVAPRPLQFPALGCKGYHDKWTSRI
jgi:hypothetical protein